MSEQNSFYGIGWQFPPSFNNKGGLTNMVTAEEDIAQSLEVLMGTVKGERVVEPKFGTDISALLFRNPSGSLATAIQTKIEDAITSYEARIILNEVQVDISQITDGKLLISIDYTIRQTNNRNNIVYPYFIQEGTLVPSRLVTRS